jgi:hypothetical protein
MIDHLFKILIAVSLMLAIEQFGYVRGYDKASEQSVSPTFWIDNECYSKDATVHPTDLYNELGEVIGMHVMIRDDRGDAFITFTDKDYATWEEDFTSWSMAFREGAKQ